MIFLYILYSLKIFIIPQKSTCIILMQHLVFSHIQLLSCVCVINQCLVLLDRSAKAGSNQLHDRDKIKKTVKGQINLIKIGMLDPFAFYLPVHSLCKIRLRVD